MKSIRQRLSWGDERRGRCKAPEADPQAILGGKVKAPPEGPLQAALPGKC